jgi:hypothetical protein
VATKRANICVFCGRAGGSDEHVFADWITDLLPGEGPFTSGGDGRRTKQSSRLAIITRSVCRECNTGWMSRLEAKAQPLLTPPIQGQPVSWSAAEQETVAAWTLKTAIALDSSHEERYAPVEHGHLLHQTGSVPTGVQVSVGMLGYELAKEHFDSAGGYRARLLIEGETSGPLPPATG